MMNRVGLATLRVLLLSNMYIHVTTNQPIISKILLNASLKCIRGVE